MVELHIRQFEKQDTTIVIQLANDYAFFDGPIDEEDLKITDAFPEGFLVAEEDMNIVGFIYGYFRDIPEEVLRNWGVSKVVTVEILAVNPKYEKQGIGTSLLERLIDIFKVAGADMFGLTCPAMAKQAKRLYEKMGFETSAYHMRLKLKPSTTQ
ncbi:MAG: GNAT family N-acetyltransferase [Candidatus Thorarchaeota archaeon]|nr:GNAT family N-acetyltransferase [Candidatus Thorarchaeota archaeon]